MTSILRPKFQAGIPLQEYRRALGFFRPHWAGFIPLFALSLVSNAVTLAQPYLTKLLIDDALGRHSMRSLSVFVIAIGVCAACAFALGALTTFWYTKLSAAILFDMRMTAFQKLQTLSPQFYSSTKTGDIVSRLNNDIGELQRLSADSLLSLPSQVLFLAGNAAMMFYLNVGLSLVGLALLPIGVWALLRYQGRLREQVQSMRERSSEIGSFLIEAILGMRLLVSCNAQERKNSEFREHNSRFVQSLLSMQLTSFLAGALPGAVLSLSVAGLFFYGGSLVIRNVITIGSLMAFMAYHARLLSPVQALMGSYSALLTGSVSLRRVFELLDREPDVTDHAEARERTNGEGKVEFRGVSFSYRGREEVLHDVSFRVAAGSTCALVGASGAGKSTVIDLLMRFYDPRGGSVLIDSDDITGWRLKDLRRAVALVDQSPFFFHTTIKENLLFAAPGATPSECEQAARQAGVHEFICSLPNEYETVLGERGLSLSVGQRQRLAIARALLRRPALLILDEPSAALDPHAELALAETLRGLASRCTILVVTHRAALVGIADQVIVLEEGRIAKSEAAIARHFGIQQSAGAAFV